MSLTNTQDLIAQVCDEIKEMLLEKNRKYGDSAINPIRIFSRSDAMEQINVRIDDKLNRKKNQQSDEDEDIDLDLVGYLVLKRVAKIKQQINSPENMAEGYREEFLTSDIEVTQLGEGELGG
jgi:hypothetical protein